MDPPASYAGLLRERFPDLDPVVDDLFLLEAHQIAGLPARAPVRQLAALLHATPALHRFLVARHPPIEGYLSGLMVDHPPVGADELATCEQDLLWELADLIVYQRDPGAYDATDEGGWVLEAIDDVVDLAGKVVVDVGAGTGRIAFEVAPLARHVFAVEPVSTLRQYMREKVGRLDIENLFTVDGFLHDIPLPAASADVLLTCRAIGWNLEEEIPEIERVVRPGGFALHLLGMPHPASPDDDLDEALVEHGYQPGSYREAAALKRKYWKQIGLA